MLPSDQQLSSFMKKIICYSSDGAAVNTGYVNGVISIFRNEVSPNIVLIKCLVHAQTGIKFQRCCQRH